MTVAGNSTELLSERHLRLLLHAVAGWILTVRGDQPEFGRSTSSARANGTLYRGFWKPFQGEEHLVGDLVESGFLFWGVTKVSVGLTRATVHFLDNTEVLCRVNPEFSRLWSQFTDEYSDEEIQAAMIVAELLSYKRDLSALPNGPEAAHIYHRLMFECLGQLFFPQLTDGRLEHELHSGIKRVDIVFANTAAQGFFHWLSLQAVRCPFVFVECKNYSGELGNPDVDQLACRLSDTRGRVGLLFCRTIASRQRLLDRCRAILNDHKGYILTFCDHDLSVLLSARAEGGHASLDLELNQRFRELVS